MNGMRPSRSRATVAFKLNGEDVAGAARRNDHRGRRSPRRRNSAPLLQAGHAAGRQLPRVHGRDQGRARAGAVVLPRADARHGGRERQRARACSAQKMIVELLAADMPERVYKPDSELEHWKEPLGIGKPRFARACPAGLRHLAPRDGGQSRRLHPVHALRARLPRGAGQRRHRLRVPRRAFEDRVRPRRSDGRRRRASRAANACRRARRARSRRPTTPIWRRSTRRWRRCVRIAASAASSPTTSRTTQIVRVEGRDGPANHERLCVKGRFGFDYVQPSAAPHASR